VPGFGRIGLKIGTVFHIRCGARPFVGAAGGGHWRQILFRHVVVSVFALFGQNSAAVCLVPFAAGQESRAATSAAAAAVKVSPRTTGQTMRSRARYLDRSSPLGSRCRFCGGTRLKVRGARPGMGVRLRFRHRFPTVPRPHLVASAAGVDCAVKLGGFSPPSGLLTFASTSHHDIRVRVVAPGVCLQPSDKRRYSVAKLRLFAVAHDRLFR
jgi:hypothetical protein